MIETAVFSLWTGADAFNTSLTRSFLEFTILSTKLAALHFPRVVLNTDQRGRELLSPLGLPCEVHTGLDAVPSTLSWNYSAGKLHTYLMMAARGTPFLHFDFDFLLWNAPRHDILTADAVCQHRFPIQPALAKFCAQHRPGGATAQSVCSSVIGGTATDALFRYAEHAIDICHDPAFAAAAKAALLTDMPWLGPCAAEEATFAAHFPNATGFLPHRYELTDDDWLDAGCGHAVGSIKTQRMTMARVERYVRLAWPKLAEKAATVTV